MPCPSSKMSWGVAFLFVFLFFFCFKQLQLLLFLLQLTGNFVFPTLCHLQLDTGKPLGGAPNPVFASAQWEFANGGVLEVQALSSYCP
jgi:hypothetical protein